MDQDDPHKYLNLIVSWQYLNIITTFIQPYITIEEELINGKDER